MIWPSTRPRPVMNLPCVLAVPASSSILAAGRLRRHWATSGPVPEPQPAATAKATPVASAVNPHDHRKSRRRIEVGREDVHVEAVLIVVRCAREHAQRRDQRADRRKFRGLANIGPRRMILWRLPAQIADRRLGVGNAEE